MKRLILDLRNNSGGDLNAGIAMAERLIPAGRLIVFTKGRAPKSSEEYVSAPTRPWPQLPLIVLVNEQSASDAEIVAGAVQDWDRGLIVGKRTFGKALVQTEYPFQDGSLLLLTTARFYTPLGRLIQKDRRSEGEAVFRTPKGRIMKGGGGIMPDVELERGVKSPPAILKRLGASNSDPFWYFADDYVSAVPREALSPDEFIRTFQITDEIFARFVGSLTTQSRPRTLRAELEACRAELADELRLAFAFRLFGEEGRLAAAVLTDDQVRQSLAYFPMAAKLLEN